MVKEDNRPDPRFFPKPTLPCVKYRERVLVCQGVSHTTARAWMGLLEARHILFILPTGYRNISKRLVKLPKLYF